MILPEVLRGVEHHRLTSEEKSDRRRRVLETRPSEDGFWVFGFGSLMWRPEFDPVDRRAATLRGYARHFHIISTTARGTPERPGLAPCLELAPESQCPGIAFRLAEERVEDDLIALWDREQNSGTYTPTWVTLETEAGPLPALTFVVEPAHPHYLGPLTVDDMAAVIAGATGRFGACRDYVANLITALGELGQRDAFLEDLLSRVDAINGVGDQS